MISMKAAGIRPKEESSAVFLIKIGILALIIRFCIGTAYYNIFISGLRAPVYAFDGEAYSIMGWYIALLLNGVNIFFLPNALVPNDYAAIGGFFRTIADLQGSFPAVCLYGINIYSYLVGIFYYLFGYSPVLLRLVNSVISVGGAFLVYCIGKKVFNEKAARIAFVLASFMPSFVLYSTSLLRDTLVNFLILMVIYQALKIESNARLRSVILPIVLSLISIALLYSLRPNAVSVFIIVAAFFLFIKFASAYRWTAVSLAGLILAFPPIFNSILVFLKSKLTLIFYQHIAFSSRGGFAFRLLPEHYYEYERMVDGSFLPNITASDLLNGCIGGIRIFLFEPSVFSAYKIQHFAALPQMILWYLIIAFACIGIIKAIRAPGIGKVALIGCLFIFTFSIGPSEANAEALIRHRDMIVPVYMIFAAYGMIEMNRGKKDKI